MLASYVFEADETAPIINPPTGDGRLSYGGYPDLRSSPGVIPKCFFTALLNEESDE